MSRESETYTQCGSKIEVMVQKGTGVCGDKCRKNRDGDDPSPIALTDAGISNLLAKPDGVNLNGIR